MRRGLAITLRHVGVRRGKRWVLEDISWTLRPGERWALIGGNGAGKTQLLRLLSTELWPTPAERCVRRYHSGSLSLSEIEVKPRIAYLGAERQDKYARYGWNFPVREVIATGLHNTDILSMPVTRTQRAIVAQILVRCGLSSVASRPFLSLSYGEKRLVLLARALVRSPDWLFLDELYNGLDDRFRRKVDVILARALKCGQSWVVAAHRARDVPPGTRRLLSLKEGRVVASRFLRASDLAKLTRPYKRVVDAGAPRRAIRETDKLMLIRLTRATVYVEYRAVLQNLNWRLSHGEQWAILGSNGSGKSSFLKMLYGDLSPAFGGSIERVGYPPGTSIEIWKRAVGLVSPELQSDYAIDVNVEEIVISGRYASIGLIEPPTEDDVRIARYWLRYFDLDLVAQRHAREVSYGQLRRVLFARTLAAAPRILLLDEPFTGLDPRQRESMRVLLGALMARGLTIVMAVHHLEDLPAGINRALRLYKRRASELSLRTAN